MSEEYMVKLHITAAGNYTVGVDKAVRGVYATGPISLGWLDNGTLGVIDPNVTKWEPPVQFEPQKTAKLYFTTAGACDIVVRMVK